MAIPLLGGLMGALGTAGGGLMSGLGGLGGILGSAGGAMGGLGGILGGVTKLAAPALSGALGGVGNLMGRDQPEETLEYAQEQKPFMRAAQAQIPLYLQVMSGGMPDFLKRYLMQTQGALQQQTGFNIQDYLRQVGQRGMDFGPATAAGMSNIYGAQIPALAQGLTQARGNIMQKGMGAMQQWSSMTPQKMMRMEQPSRREAATGGALQGVSRGLGQPAEEKPVTRNGSPPSLQEPPKRKPLGQDTVLGGGKRFDPQMLQNILRGR